MNPTICDAFGKRFPAPGLVGALLSFTFLNKGFHCHFRRLYQTSIRFYHIDAARYGLSFAIDHKHTHTHTLHVDAVTLIWRIMKSLRRYKILPCDSRCQVSG